MKNSLTESGTNKIKAQEPRGTYCKIAVAKKRNTIPDVLLILLVALVENMSKYDKIQTGQFLPKRGL